MDRDQINGLRAELNGLLRFRREQNILSFLAFFASVALGAAGFYLKHKEMDPQTYVPVFVTAALVYLFAFVCYCRYKGRSPLWAISILTAYLSLLLLAVLRDNYGKRIEFLQGILPPEDEADGDEVEVLETA